MSTSEYLLARAQSMEAAAQARVAALDSLLQHVADTHEQASASSQLQRLVTTLEQIRSELTRERDAAHQLIVDTTALRDSIQEVDRLNRGSA